MKKIFILMLLFLFAILLMADCQYNITGNKTFAPISIDDLQDEEDYITVTMILYIQQHWYANIIQRRFDKAIASNNYFECGDNFCFEIDEDDLDLRYGILKRRVIPKRFSKNIEVFEIMPVLLEDGTALILE